MSIKIVNDRIEGTRVSVFDVYYYQTRGRSRAEIADILRITPEELQAAEEYIEGHRDEVHAVHENIEERNRRGNPPEIEALAAECHKRMQEWLEARRKAKEEVNGAGHPGGRQHREAGKIVD
jgi:hypothetical protein